MNHLERLKEFGEIISASESPASRILVTGVTSSARADFLYSFLESTGKKGLIIVENMYEAKVLKEDLSFYLNPDKIFIFPEREYIFHNIETAEQKLTYIRIDILTRLATGDTAAECEKNYLSLLSANGVAIGDTNGFGVEVVEGTIADIRTAVQDGNSVYYFQLIGSPTYYTITAVEQPLAVILSKGDQVTITYRGADGAIHPAVDIQPR